MQGGGIVGRDEKTLGSGGIHPENGGRSHPEWTKDDFNRRIQAHVVLYFRGAVPVRLFRASRNDPRTAPSGIAGGPRGFSIACCGGVACSDARRDGRFFRDPPPGPMG